MGFCTAQDGVLGFVPDNTADTLHIESYGPITMGDLMESASKHFARDVDVGQVSVESICIQTRNVNIDGYRSLDWTDFIVITLNA